MLNTCNVSNKKGLRMHMYKNKKKQKNKKTKQNKTKNKTKQKQNICSPKGSTNKRLHNGLLSVFWSSTV